MNPASPARDAALPRPSPVTRLYLVRHGRATGGWDDEPDPGLDDVGREQAARVALEIASLGPLAIVTSPLRRARETALPLAQRWGAAPVVEPRVGEVPSPEGVPMGERVPWLRETMSTSWSALGARYARWRDDVVAALLERTTDTVVFSHFIAINAAIGSATNDDRVVIASLDNTSVTVFDVSDGRLLLRSQGREADTLIR